MARQGRRVAGWIAVMTLGWACVARADGFKPAAAPVPPTQEIVVLDPGVDPTGNPAVLVRPGLAGQVIDIPPAVLVHRFYYTGDRTFQGPLLPGGPVIVAVNHPSTFERVYVPVTMPPGAPKVTYSSHSIRYDYGPQSVTLKFGLCGKPTVYYSQGTKIGEKTRDALASAEAAKRDLVRRMGIKEGIQRFSEAKKSLLAASTEAMTAARLRVTDPILSGMQSLTEAIRPVGEATTPTAASATRPLIEEPFRPRVP